MPNITIYLNDEEYKKFFQLRQKQALKEKFKEFLKEHKEDDFARAFSVTPIKDGKRGQQRPMKPLK